MASGADISLLNTSPQTILISLLDCKDYNLIFRVSEYIQLPLTSGELQVPKITGKKKSSHQLLDFVLTMKADLSKEIWVNSALFIELQQPWRL